jgi:hypothetical protein
MSNFNIINRIKEEFSENLSNANGYFKKTKQAFNDFDDFLGNNPKVVISLASAALVATAALGYDIYQSTQSVSLDMYNTSKVAQVKNRTEAITTEFLKVPNELSQIKNKNYNENQYEANNGIHDYIKDQPQNKGTVFKNPFWPNNIVTVYNKPNESSKYHPESLQNNPIDTSNHIIDMDYIETKAIANRMQVDEDKQYLVDSFVFYHEAAHASYSQSVPYAGMTTNRIDTELMSDISSLIYMGHERKGDFDYMIDKVIQERILGLSNDENLSGFSHNTLYGLIELKKAVQKNPLLLDMQPESISQFSDMFVKELKSVNLSQHHTKSLEGFIYPTVDEIKKDINENNKAKLYQAVTFYQLYEGGENNKYNRTVLPSIKSSLDKLEDIPKISESIADVLKSNLRYDTLASTVLKNSNNDPKEAVRKMTDMVDKNPVLKNDFITAIAKGNLIYMDDLKVNIAPVKEIEEAAKQEQLRLREQKNENTNKRKVELQKPTMNNNKTS